MCLGGGGVSAQELPCLRVVDSRKRGKCGKWNQDVPAKKTDVDGNGKVSANASSISK